MTTTIDDRLAALAAEERQVGLRSGALLDELMAARAVTARIQHEYDRCCRQLATIAEERKQLLDERQRGRLYRERGA